MLGSRSAGLSNHVDDAIQKNHSLAIQKMKPSQDFHPIPSFLMAGYMFLWSIYHPCNLIITCCSEKYLRMYFWWQVPDWAGTIFVEWKSKLIFKDSSKLIAT